MNLLADSEGKILAAGLEWLHEPPEWFIDDKGLTIVPAGGTDFFHPYDGRATNDNCCLLYKKISGDFTAATQVKATLEDFGDAAAMTMRVSESQWAKICVERSPIGDISLVSVVTDPWSDDANSELLETAECHMRVTRKGNNFGMHYSLDGKVWRLIRAYSMEMPEEVMVGIHVQAPFTPGARGTFSSLTYSSEPVADLRSGA